MVEGGTSGDDWFAVRRGTNQSCSVLGFDRFYLYFVDLAANLSSRARRAPAGAAGRRRRHRGLFIGPDGPPKTVNENDAGNADHDLAGLLGSGDSSAFLVVHGKPIGPSRPVF